MNAGFILAIRTVAGACAFATIGLMVWAVSWSWSGLAFVIGLMAWCVSPYAFLAFAARGIRASRAGAVALLVTTLLAGGLAGAAYVDSFFIHLDAQGALVLVFMPVVQWAGALVGVVVASALDSRARKASPQDPAKAPR